MKITNAIEHRDATIANMHPIASAGPYADVDARLAAVPRDGDMALQIDSGEWWVGVNGAWRAIGMSLAQFTQMCGDGSDGDLILSSGTVTLSRDLYCRNIVCTGGLLITNGFQVFYTGVRDWRFMPTGTVVQSTTLDGSSANGTNNINAGIGGTRATGTLGTAAGGLGGTGTVGTTTAGSIAGAGQAGQQGGSSGSSGSGGVGAGGLGGTGRGSPTVILNATFRRWVDRLISNSNGTVGGLSTGAGAPSGASGGGSGTVVGGGPGAGGASPNPMYFSGNIFLRGPSTGVGAVSCKGGKGGKGGNGGQVGCGGGSGGPGAGGGWYYDAFLQAQGSVAVNMVDLSGGDGAPVIISAFGI